MAMDNLAALITQFSEDYEQFSQQDQSRIASVVKKKSFKGETYNDDYQNAIDISDIITNRATGAATVDKTLGFTRRRLSAATQTWSIYKSDKDVAEMMKDPESEIVREMINVMNRKRDAVTLAAMVGNVDQYNTGTGVFDATALPASQKVAAGATGLTVAKLREASKVMNAGEVPRTGRCIGVNAEQLDGLLGETEVTSSDYNTVKTLVQGEIDTFLGFKFIHTELITGPAIAFQKDKVLFGYNLDRKIDIAKDPAHNMDYVIHIEEQFGAIRREDAGIVEIAVA